MPCGVGFQPSAERPLSNTTYCIPGRRSAPAPRRAGIASVLERSFSATLKDATPDSRFAASGDAVAVKNPATKRAWVHRQRVGWVEAALPLARIVHRTRPKPNARGKEMWPRHAGWCWVSAEGRTASLKYDLLHSRPQERASAPQKPGSRRCWSDHSQPPRRTRPRIAASRLPGMQLL
jgi:hypothetical protein